MDEIIINLPIYYSYENIEIQFNFYNIENKNKEQEENKKLFGIYKINLEKLINQQYSEMEKESSVVITNVDTDKPFEKSKFTYQIYFNSNVFNLENENLKKYFKLISTLSYEYSTQNEGEVLKSIKDLLKDLSNVPIKNIVSNLYILMNSTFFLLNFLNFSKFNFSNEIKFQ
jgi:hypothetical protein